MPEPKFKEDRRATEMIEKQEERKRRRQHIKLDIKSDKKNKSAKVKKASAPEPLPLEKSKVEVIEKTFCPFLATNCRTGDCKFYDNECLILFGLKKLTPNTF